MNKHVSIKELVPVFKEILDSGSSVNFTPKGVSMLPMLHNNTDVVQLNKPNGKLKKYDLPLYYYKSSDKYILHRVIKVEKDGTYTMCGDNCAFLEKGVTDEDIVAVVTEFTRDGRKYSVKDIRYKIYCRFWVGKKNLKWKYYSFKEKIYPYYRKIIKK